MSGRRISNSISITTVYDGENSVHLDLDNENDSMLYDGNGTTLLSGNVTSRAYLYDGIEPVTSGVSFAETHTSGVTASMTGNVITVTGMTVMSGSVTVTATYNGQTYKAQLTLKKIVGGDKYDLVIAPNAIAYNTSETWSAKTITINASRLTSNGVRTPKININSTQTKIYLAAYYKTTESGTASWSQVNGGTSTDRTLSITENMAKFNENILFELRKEVSGKTYNVGTPSTYTIEDYETIPINKAKNGNNAIRLALDNEHEDFIYSDKQELPVAPSANVGAKSTIHLYDGEEKTLTTSMLSIDGSSSGVPTTGGYVPTIISEDGKIKLKVPHITANTAKVVVKATYPSTNGHDYYAEFTANKTNQDKYDLNLKPNAIAYNPATYETQSITISGTRTDLQGNKSTLSFGTGSTDISTQDNNGKIRLFVTYVNASGTTVTVRQKSARFSVTKGTNNIADRNTGIYFELRKYADASTADSSTTGYTIADYETVEIAKTANGDDAMVYSIECTDILKPNDDYHSVRIIRSEGSDIQIKTLDSAKTSWSVYLTASPNTVVVDDSSKSQIDVTGLTINKQTVVTLTLHQGSTTGTVIATKELRGIEDGAKGELGKMCYIAGEYSDDITYTSNDRQTVAVEVTVSGQEEADVWVLEYSTNVINGHHVPPTPVNPTDTTVSYNGQVIWRKGLSKYNLIRTTYLFADFAKLGSGVVSGDWLFSANGTICGQAFNNGAFYYGKAAYMYFDDGYPNGIAIKTSTFDSNTVDLCNAFTLKKGSHALFVRGRRTGGSGNVRIYLVRNSAVIRTKDITSNTSTVVQFDFTEDSNSATYYLRADGTVSGTTGEVTHIGGFTPNYAVDLLTGTTYFSGDNDKYVKINNTGIEGFWNNDGFRLTADGLQRYDLRSGTWGPMFAGRRVDVISSNKTIDKTYDFILARNTTNFTLTLPTISDAGQGKVFTIQSTSQDRSVTVKASGSDKFIAGSSQQTTSVPVNNYERLELVGYGGIWYAIRQVWENDS